jgi:hypothetical protein
MLSAAMTALQIGNEAMGYTLRELDARGEPVDDTGLSLRGRVD